MVIEPARSGPTTCLAAALALAVGVPSLVAIPRTAQAFPLIEPGEGTPVPSGQNLETTDAQALKHQLQIANGIASASGGGWAIVPRLDWQEMFTDNVLQQHAPRRWDIVTYVAPGVSLAANAPRLQLQFDYNPTLAMYARTPSQNALGQQLSGTASVIVIPELLFVDVRALSGVQSLNGGIGGVGGLGAGGGGGFPAGGSVNGATTLGTTKDNLVQTSSVSIAPYALYRFGDIGSGRVGASYGLSRSSQLSGFAAVPLPLGSGGNGQILQSTEENAHFVSGDILGRFQDAVDINFGQSKSTREGSFNVVGSGIGRSTQSNRATASNQLTFKVTQAIAVFASLGYESISYTGTSVAPISDMTWSVGTTLTPNPDSSITLSYGHREGADSFSADGHYTFSPRTAISVNYSSTVGTQLENLQRQLDGSTININGTLVDTRTGQPLIGANNALAVQPGVFRTNGLSLTLTTSIDRDNFALSTFLTTQTSLQAGSGTSSDAKTISGQWTHAMSPDLSLTSSVSYSIVDTSGSTVASTAGSSTSLFANVALRYALSDKLSTNLRYSYYNRNGANALANVSTNLVVLGISKLF